MVPGTSNPVESRIGLPVCRDSVRARSSARSSSRAASRCSAAERSTGGAPDQPGKAARAAATAASTSEPSASTHLLDGLAGGGVDDVEASRPSCRSGGGRR